jgi:XTP/dITP diphosphohydrolase
MSSCDLSSGIVVGTHNHKKLLELRALLEPLAVSLQSLAEIPQALTVPETGTTFIENARLKATVQARHLGRWTIGEDSGLCVPALGGEPGVYSARYAGPNATDELNNAKLLSAMSNLTGDARRAYYICTIALSDPNGEVQVEAEGECWGRILTARRGAGGFGYDPLFEIPEYHRTFAELGLSVKSALSHRARALRQFLAKLTALRNATA